MAVECTSLYRCLYRDLNTQIGLKAFRHKPVLPGLWRNAHTIDMSGSVTLSLSQVKGVTL